MIRIEWPSGIVQELTNVAAKQVLTVTEPTELVALGEGRIWVRCWKGMKYEVEVSNDLAAWMSLGVFTNETGRLEVIDADAAQHPYRFYRAIAR